MELIFDPDTVEGYIAGGCPHLAASSRATRRAYLRSYGRQITTTAPWPPSIRPLRQDYAVVPYSDAEVARLLEVAASQRTTTQRRHLQALLALGLGAGLFPKESWSVTTDDLMEKHGVLCLTVPGNRPRVCRSSRPTTTRCGRSAEMIQARHCSATSRRNGTGLG